MNLVEICRPRSSAILGVATVLGESKFQKFPRTFKNFWNQIPKLLKPNLVFKNLSEPEKRTFFKNIQEPVVAM